MAGSGSTDPGCGCAQGHGVEMPRLVTYAGTSSAAAWQVCVPAHTGCPGAGYEGLRASCAASGLGLGSPGAWRTLPNAVGCVWASLWCHSPGSPVLRGLSWWVAMCRCGPEQDLAISVLIWESSLILHKEPYQSLSVLGAQTPSRSTVLNIYCSQGIMHLFKCIINAFKCVRLYQNAQQSLPVRPPVTRLTKKLLLAY